MKMILVTATKKLIQDAKKWTWRHLSTFLLTFFIYALYHSCRKSFTNVKDLMAKSLSPLENITYPNETWKREVLFNNVQDANVFLGELDFLFLLAYGIGMYLSGIVGDRVNVKYMAGFGIIGSSISTFLFGYIPVPFQIHNKWYFRCLFFINGLFQSTGRPALLSVMASWFHKSSLGLVFGTWAINSSLGNMIGALIVASTIDYGYEYSMLSNSLLSFCGGIVALFFLIPDPGDLRISITEEGKEIDVESFDAKYDGKEKEISNEKPELKIQKEKIDLIESNVQKPIEFSEAFLIPGVIPYALANACVKTVSYSFFFWLPTYLAQGLQWSDKDSSTLSNCFDIGGIVGTIVTGVISDFFPYRSAIVSFSLILSVILVYLYQTFAIIPAANILLMLLIGCTLQGPSSLITSVITADLGKNDKINGDKKAIATVSGIIDGTGSLGAALGQFLVGVISKYYGWQWVFKFLLIMISMGFMFIFTIHVDEIKTWRKKRAQTINI